MEEYLGSSKTMSDIAKIELAIGYSFRVIAHLAVP
jgi:hypothetical protein